MTTPTPGALRAARWIEQQHFDGVCLGPVAVQQIAQEIDSETGLPELVEALRFAADAYNDELATGSLADKLYEVSCTARAALAKAKGEK